MKALELLGVLRAAGVRLTADGDKLKVTAPKGVLDESLQREIAHHKPQLLALIGFDATVEPELVGAPRPELPTMSLGQERLWTMEAHNPGTSRYNLPLAFRLKGPLDTEALIGATEALIQRHETLRSAVSGGIDRPVLTIQPTPHTDAIACERAPEGASSDWIQRWVRAEVERPFDLAAGPLLRMRIAVLGPQDHILTLVMHHFVSDGWSFEVFFDELSRLYSTNVNRASVELPALRVEYSEFAAWQRARLGEDRRRLLEEFWRTLFKDPPAPLRLPSTTPTGADTRTAISIPAESVAQIGELASSEGSTPFAVFLSTYVLLLASLTNSQDIVLCSPTAGRDREELRDVIGYLNNVLPLRLPVDPDASFAEHVRTVRDAVLEAHRYQELPFQDIVALPEVAHTRLTRGMFAYHGQPLRSLRLEGIDIESLPVPEGAADFDLSLSLDGKFDGIEAALVCRPGTLGRMAPEAFLVEYVELLARVVADPHRSISELMASVSVAFDSASFATEGRGIGPSDQARFHPRQDPLELQMTVAWERVFGVHGIAPTDDFFLLGGHSLLAVQLLDVVEQEIGHRLPLSLLVQQPTVRGFTRAIQNQGWSPPEGSLIPLETTARGGTPIILPHSFEGHVFLFRELARRLGATHPVYGLQAVGLDGSHAPHRSVEEMAEHYLELIDLEFGEGPVMIAGLCFGVSVGLEMARRRRAAGLDVDLVLIDSSWEHFTRPGDLGPLPSLWERARLRAARTSEHWKWWWTETATMMTGSLYARRESAIRRRTARAWTQYVPQPYTGRITLIRAAETAANPAKDWQVRALDIIAQGELVTVEVPGHHFKFLREPLVGGVAAQIRQAVEKSAADR